MNGHQVIWVSGLLGISVALALICCVGVLVMNDAYQRLQFAAPIVGVSMSLLVAAVWIQESGSQVRVKAVLICVILFLTNAVLSHATARAIKVKTHGKLEVDEGQGIEWSDGTPYRPGSAEGGADE
jgi:monovalent cation/proton antiporter MnhG/PhaG subunit